MTEEKRLEIYLTNIKVLKNIPLLDGIFSTACAKEFCCQFYTVSEERERESFFNNKLINVDFISIGDIPQTEPNYLQKQWHISDAALAFSN